MREQNDDSARAIIFLAYGFAAKFTALLDTLAATLPGYGSIPFILDEDFNIAQGLIRMVGVGKIVRRDKMPPLPDAIV